MSQNINLNNCYNTWQQGFADENCSVRGFDADLGSIDTLATGGHNAPLEKTLDQLFHATTETFASCPLNDIENSITATLNIEATTEKTVITNSADPEKKQSKREKARLSPVNYYQRQKAKNAAKIDIINNLV